MRIVSVLKYFGFSDYEAKALISLLSRGEMSAKDIAEVSGIPRTSVYDVMSSLESKGFVEAFGKPKRFKAIRAEEIISILSEKAGREIEFLQKELPKLSSTEVEEIRIYRGDLVLEKLRELVEETKENIFGILSYISEDVKEILERCRSRLVLISLNASEVKNAEAYEFERRDKVVDSFREHCHGLLIFDDKKTIFLFRGQSSLGVVSESRVIANFSKMMLMPVLDLLKSRKID
jgi:sugar-specific transcriptional regulator TrmB